MSLRPNLPAARLFSGDRLDLLTRDVDDAIDGAGDDCLFVIVILAKPKPERLRGTPVLDQRRIVCGEQLAADTTSTAGGDIYPDAAIISKHTAKGRQGIQWQFVKMKVHGEQLAD